MNEKWTVVGFRSVNFTDEKTNKQINGYSLFLLRSPNAYENKVTGQICEKLFVSSEYVKYTPELGDEIVLVYNKYGKVSSIQVV